MTRWFTRVAVFAAWLGLGTQALAQEGFPSPVGAARLPEPINYIPDQPVPTNMVPGPVNPLMAPVGPPPSLNLPVNHTSAFMLDHYPPESKLYASLGGQGLRRQGITRLPVAFSDVNSLGRDTGLTPIGLISSTLGPEGADASLARIINPVLDTKNAEPLMTGGMRATAGYLFANVAVELTGFWNPSATQRGTITSPGTLFVPFGPNNAIPVGFEGNANLWRQADLVQVRYTGSVASAEANFRTWNAAVNEFELILGLRYFYAQERVDIYTDDDFNTRDIFQRPDPTRAATYTAGVRNNYLGFQMGGEYGTPLPFPWLHNSVWAVVMAKASLGPNFVERTFRLTRGDGFLGFDRHENSVLLASVNEIYGGLDFHVLERLRVRAGYTFIWALGFTDAAGQIDYNFSTQGASRANSGSVFYHGPVGEIQFLF